MIGKLEFEGPFMKPEEIRPDPGIYGILCQVNDEFELIDLDDSHCLRDCLETTEHVNNMLFYAETCQGMLSAIVHYTPDLTASERAELKSDLLAEMNDQSYDPELEPAC
jgi:hypothetical protein